MLQAGISRSSKGARTLFVSAAGAVAAAVLLSGCSGGSSDAAEQLSPATSNGGSGGEGKGGKEDKAAAFTVDPANGAQGVTPGQPVTVTATEGSLANVRLTDAKGGAVEGTLAEGGRSWTTTGKTLPGASYTLQITTRTKGGKEATATSAFATLKAEKVNKVSMVPTNGGTFGIAQPVSITFDYQVQDKAAVERALTVTTSPQTEGSWGWVKDLSGKDRIDWRPRDFWKTGTTVTLDARLGGVASAPGTWFVRDYKTSFTVGTNRVLEVVIPEHQVNVIEDGVTVKTIPMSAGSPTWPTRGGTHVILAKNATETLDSQSVGLGDSYLVKDVPWVMHFTSSGTFFHSAEWNTGNFGRVNTSHGCVGMSIPDAKWLYDRASVGDPVVVKGSKSTKVTEPGNGFGAWQLSYDEWKTKSALN